MNTQGTKSVTTEQEMPTFSATDARNNFSDVFNRAHYGGGVLIENRGKRVAVVPMELLERLAELEAFIDSAEAQKALEEFHTQGGVGMDEFDWELDDA